MLECRNEADNEEILQVDAIRGNIFPPFTRLYFKT